MAKHNDSTRIDLAAAFASAPAPLDFVLPGFLSGTVGALFSPGATGKSFLTLEAAMCIACDAAGGDLLQLGLEHHGRVVYFAAEDPRDVLLHRLYAIGQYLPPAARQQIAENLDLEAVLGRRLDLMDERHQQRIIEYCAGARLIVFDTISRMHRLDENSNGDMAQLLQALEYIAAKTGAGGLFLHHVSKSSARDGQADQQHAARGASVLTDNARWGAALSRMSDDEADAWSDSTDGAPIGAEQRGYYVRLSIPKNNYGGVEQDRWFRRERGGVLVPATLIKASKAQAARGKNRDAASY